MTPPVAAARPAPSVFTDEARPQLRALRCRLCGAPADPTPVAVCERCLGPLEPAYDPSRRLPSRDEIARRPRSLWRYAEWLPLASEPLLSLDTGFTPLIEAPALARALGVRRALVKNDAVSHPTCSFKDRVVAVALNAAVGLGLDTVGCASTGNLANAVAAQAARAGLKAWIFIPEDLELGKVVGTAVYGPRLVRVRGTYDEVNRLCVQVADRFGWGIVNVNLRGYYGEGSKTMAFEIAEQLGWRLPDAVIAPMAGGSLVTKLDKGFREFLSAGLVDGPAPRMYGAQAQGCAPIVNLVASGGETVEPVVPQTIARSIAIGTPPTGGSPRARSGGAAATPRRSLTPTW
jgi:threonine synthase